MVLKIFLQGVDSRRSCRIFTLHIIPNKIKPTKAARYALSLITWTNHSKKATRMSLCKTLMSIWPSSRDVLQWDNIWKWNQLNGVLNGGLDVRAQMVAYTKLSNSNSLLDFKIVVSKSLIGRFSNQQRSFPLSRTSKRKALESSLPKEIPTHMPEFNEECMRCNFCKNEGADHKTFVSCPTCGLYWYCTKERNCFLKHHI